MAEFKLIGQSFTPQDLVAKITGRAKYAEDFRAEGMLFAKLLHSPLPHAIVRSIDYSEALALPGVVGILTADEVPQDDFPSEPPLTNHPRYEGEAILAVAAVDELTAAEAIELIKVEYEPLSFSLNPLESLKPGSPNPHENGNVWVPREGGGGQEVGEVKWDQAIFDAAAPDQFPKGPWVSEWEYGEGGVDAAFERADFVLEETLYCQSISHHPMEPRTSMAYWENGKVHIFCSVQSVAQTRQGYADRLGLDFEDVVFVSEFCGGGFGSKIRGSVIDTVPALLSRKLGGRPVQLRISRAEEALLGRGRPGMMGWAKMGFRSDGRLIALDLQLVQDSGAYSSQGDVSTAGSTASLMYQPETMRFRSTSVITNTPPRAAQRGPGGVQAVSMLEPMMDRAARGLGIDRLQIRLINAPSNDSGFGPQQRSLTSNYTREALIRGAELFNWEEKSRLSGQRNGTKVRGVAVTLSPYTAGSSGWDGLLIIRPDGKLYIHQGVGNLGSHSVMDTAKAAAEALDAPWELCEVVWGNSANQLPYSSTQSGSQTTHAHTRANWVVGQAMKQLLQELAALELGGSPSSYVVSGGRVYRQGSPSVGLSFAQAAERAIARGGKFSGYELPENIRAMTRSSATALAGQGLIAAARDTLPHTAATYSTCVNFLELDLDIETGQHEILNVTTVVDVGTVVNPRSLEAQGNGGTIQGIGMAKSFKWAFDPTWGVNLTKRLEATKPPTMLDVPTTFAFDAVNIPDPQNPVGARGIGEPSVGAGAAALICALEDAMGGAHPTHQPVTPDKIVSILELGCLPCGRLETHV